MISCARHGDWPPVKRVEGRLLFWQKTQKFSNKLIVLCEPDLLWSMRSLNSIGVLLVTWTSCPAERFGRRPPGDGNE